MGIADLDKKILHLLLRMRPHTADSDLEVIACANVIAEIMETTPTNLSPRARIRRWSQNA